MPTSPRKLDARRRVTVASFLAAPTLVGCLLAIFLVAVPMTRASENNERANSSERCEELTLASRHDRARSLAQDDLHAAHVRATVVMPLAGKSQLSDLDPPAGHRLPNGLLAPMTC